MNPIVLDQPLLHVPVSNGRVFSVHFEHLIES